MPAMGYFVLLALMTSIGWNKEGMGLVRLSRWAESSLLPYARTKNLMSWSLYFLFQNRRLNFQLVRGSALIEQNIKLARN